MSDPRHLPATHVGTRQLLTLVDHSPTLLDDAGAPTFNVRQFNDPRAFLREITARKDQIALAGHGYLEPQEPIVLERTICHLVLIPRQLGLEGACVPAGFAYDRALPSPEVTPDDVRRRLVALARSAETMARQWEGRAVHDTKHRTLARELREQARQLRRTAEMVGAPAPTEPEPEAVQANLF